MYSFQKKKVEQNPTEPLSAVRKEPGLLCKKGWIFDTCDEVEQCFFINNELMTALALSSWIYREKCETNLSECEEARIPEGDRIYF